MTPHSITCQSVFPVSSLAKISAGVVGYVEKESKAGIQLCVPSLPVGLVHVLVLLGSVLLPVTVKKYYYF